LYKGGIYNELGEYNFGDVTLHLM